MEILYWCVFCCALVPGILFAWNLYLYKRPCAAKSVSPVSILIPARNEEGCIERSVRAALRSRNVDLEVIVLDDHSTDRTLEIVQSIKDPRLVVVSAPMLPADWCGKQFACWTLANLATKPYLCFVDADVVLKPDAAANLCEHLQQTDVALLSGFPHQQVETVTEQLLIPLMHFILLGFLPMFWMRRTTDPAYSAGCGQLFLADRAAYMQAGGHAAIRESRHDGLKLPRAFRVAGFRTGLCDATELADCRMYQNAREVFNGLTKNATEGLAAPQRIFPFTAILMLGQVLPAFMFNTSRLAAAALLLSLGTRLVAAIRFRQPVIAAFFQPLSIALLLLLQWIALVRSMLGVPSSWKGRNYACR